MMKLVRLWAVARTLDANRTSPIATQIAQAWASNIVPGYVRTSANYVFRVDRGDDSHFLRFAHESERSRLAIEQEMELLVWLQNAGIRANTPVATADGELVATVDTEFGRFHAVLLTGVAGEHLDIDQINPSRFTEWGEAVGDLHAKFDRLPDRLRRPPAWRATLAEAAQAGGLLARESAVLGAALSGLPDDPGSFGPIHTDLELDNLLWNGATFGFIDFDEYVSSWRAADIAKALDELEAEPDDPRIEAFVAGYRSRHPLTDEARASLPLMSRLFDLGMYLRVRRAFEDPLDDEGTRTLERVIVNLITWMNRYEARTANRLDA